MRHSSSVCPKICCWPRDFAELLRAGETVMVRFRPDAARPRCDRAAMARDTRDWGDGTQTSKALENRDLISRRPDPGDAPGSSEYYSCRTAFIDVVMPDAERASLNCNTTSAKSELNIWSKCLGNSLGKSPRTGRLFDCGTNQSRRRFRFDDSACDHNLAGIVAPPPAPSSGGCLTPASLRPDTWRVSSARAQSPRVAQKAKHVMSARIRVDTHPFTTAPS